MKGVILAGGTGSRLWPLTKITNKHLLPVYDQPMIFYPLRTLVSSGIDEIAIVSGRGHAGHFLELLGSGAEHGVHLTYEIQEKSGGIAEALDLTRRWAGDDHLAVILGDNIFQDTFPRQVSQFSGGAHIFLKPVNDAHRFGAVRFNDYRKVEGIEEKSDPPPSQYAVTGLYLYDAEVFSYIDTLDRSERGELEITDVNNQYITAGTMDYTEIHGFWSDAGTFESLHRAGTFVRESHHADNVRAARPQTGRGRAVHAGTR